MIPFRLQVIEECGSTNDELLGRREQPDFPGSALLALRQTAGRGRRGRQWETGEGNLALSVAFRLGEAQAWRAPLLPFWMGVALFTTLERMGLGPRLRLKWPNDLYLDHKKLAGMLSQARQGAEGVDLVIGVGVNLQPAPAGLNAASLAEAGVSLSPESLAVSLLAELERAWLHYQDFPSLRLAWEAAARLDGQPLCVVGEAEPVYALALLESGELLVVGAQGERKLASEEVSLRF